MSTVSAFSDSFTELVFDAPILRLEGEPVC
jgi:hypothetical protein